MHRTLAGVLVFGLTASAVWAAGVRGDFNGDGKSDVFWRHGVTGQNAVWSMNGATLTSTALTSTVADLNWQVVGTGDFNGDGKSDVLWRHAVTGQNAVWLMNGATLASAALTNTVADLKWQVVGIGDFDGDGKSDVLWRHAVSGQNAVWFMNGVTLASGALTNTVADLNWQVVGAGDFNGDGQSDIFWRHAVSGQNAVWVMNGATLASGALTNTVADLNWRVVGTGDFNGDGQSDIFWRHAVSGQNAVWVMNGATLVSGALTNTVADLNWRVVGTGDFNGDGKSDILWRHAVSGQNAVWVMNGATLANGALTNTVADLNWRVQPQQGTTAPDTTPDSFSFTAQTGVALSSVVTSNTITVSGINASTTISITGGSYSINGGAYTTAAGSVNNGNTVTVRVTSSSSYGTQLCATLNIGGVAGQFCVTTVASFTVTLYPSADNLLLVNSLNSAVMNTVYQSGEVAVGCNWAYSSITFIQDFVCAMSLAKFNLTTLAGKTIDSATLTLTTDYVGVGSYPRTWHIRALSTAWSPAAVTWNNFAGSYSYYIASNINQSPPTFVGQLYNINLAATVQAWANGTYANNGLIFEVSNYDLPYSISYDAFAFHSVEAGGTLRPALTVTYH